MLTETQLRALIREELGVACEVSHTANEILAKIESCKGKEPVQKEFYEETNGGFEQPFLGSNIKVAYTYRNFKTEDAYRYAMKRNPEHRDGNSLFFNKRMILMHVWVCGYCGNIDNASALETIYHELEHIYQQMMIGSEFKEGFYIKLRKGMASKEENEYKAARLLYGCLKSEQEGFCNGLYGYLMAEPTMLDYEKINETDCLKTYNEIVEIYNELADNEELRKYVDEYHMSMKWIKKELDNFKWRIGRILAKVENDKIEYQGWRK